jgi:hypothetical protein
MINYFPGVASVTATAGEQYSITQQSGITSSTAALVDVAEDYAIDSPAYSGTFADYAAIGQTGSEAGLIGATVAAKAALPATVTPASIATAVAEAATTPGGSDFNDTLYAVAQQFGLQSGSTAGTINYTNFGGVGGVAVSLAALATGGTNNAAVAAIATAITEHINNPAYIILICEYVAYKNPVDGPDIFGSVFDTLAGSNGAPLATLEAEINPMTLETDIEGAAQASVLYGIGFPIPIGPPYNPWAEAYTLAVTDQPEGPAVDPYYYGLTPDETSILDL